MHPTLPHRCVLALLLFSSLVAADIAQCLEDFKNDPNATGGVDSLGRPTSPAEAVGLTYLACTERCGSGGGSFGWNEFARSLSTWVLPWLALISRLPFGSGNYVDDITSVVMSVGSPALAAYSLMVTSINVRLVYRRAQQTKHESSHLIARALISLQQIPLELTQDERLLAFIAVKNQWRREMVDRLNTRNVFSIAAGLFIGWVTITFVFIVISSFVSLEGSGDDSYGGHAIATLWLWLLCLVIGWFRVPAYTRGELESTVGHVNEKAAKKVTKMIKQNTRAMNFGRSDITRRLPKQTVTRRRSSKSVSDSGFRTPGENATGEESAMSKKQANPVPLVCEELEKVEVESIQEDDEPVGQVTKPPVDRLPHPIYHRSTVDTFHDYTQSRIKTNPNPGLSTDSLTYFAAGYSAARSSVHPEEDRLLIPKDGASPLNRDEFRLAATFNYSRVIRYLALVDDVWRALDRPTRKKGERKDSASESTASLPPKDVVFPPGTFISMFGASIFALILQCGIMVASCTIVIFTPTVGVSCQALGYILYGVMSLLILFLTIGSTILARISETRGDRPSAVKTLTGFIAVGLRRTSLLFAYINAVGLIILTCLQLSSFLDSCYCNASVIGRGTNSYVLTTYQGWIPTMRASRISATVLSVVSMTTYMTFLWITSAFPPA